MITGRLVDMLNQTRAAEAEIARTERELQAQGFVNTMHDCWELPETPARQKARTEARSILQELDRIIPH